LLTPQASQADPGGQGAPFCPNQTARQTQRQRAVRARRLHKPRSLTARRCRTPRVARAPNRNPRP
jgi:hypothetical protein